LSWYGRSVPACSRRSLSRHILIWLT
jgi:hypothetical protein